MSQHSCGNIIIIIIILLSFLFMLKSGHRVGITWCSNYNIMPKIMLVYPTGA